MRLSVHGLGSGEEGTTANVGPDVSGEPGLWRWHIFFLMHTFKAEVRTPYSNFTG
jgi:hypothetical protein